MKIDDIIFEGDDESRWQPADRGALLAKGRYCGAPYSVKLYASEPKWYCADELIAEAEERLKDVQFSDSDYSIATAMSRLEILKREKEKHDKNDAAADGFLRLRQNLVDIAMSIGDKYIAAPVRVWKQKVQFKGDGTYALEMAPWITGTVEADKLEEKQKYEFIASLAKRLSILHGKGILYNNLCLKNVLAVRDEDKIEAAIVDFGSAFLLKDLYSREYGFESWYYIVSGRYFAPEYMEFLYIVRNEHDEELYNGFDLTAITEKADIFGLGITAYEIFYGRADERNFVPFKSPDGGLDCAAYGEAVKADYKPDFPHDMDDFLYGMLNWMLDKDPNKRPTASEVAALFASRDVWGVPKEYRRK